MWIIFFIGLGIVVMAVLAFSVFAVMGDAKEESTDDAQTEPKQDGT